MNAIKQESIHFDRITKHQICVPRETVQRLCKHRQVRLSGSRYVAEYYCATCGEWLYDKDVE